MSEIVPASLDKATTKANQAFTRMLDVHNEVPAYDFKEGVYEGCPKDPRGI